ncbi:thiol-disulfide oxidoreductase DCC family protein [Salinactinospora qingdaonensis]|uniref:thiol-disulfide oxidoreductase DCC family protein n=1 Tax=Salinactinospora qingdaonensis TaxID=702744 RepID=UPI0031EFD79A
MPWHAADLPPHLRRRAAEEILLLHPDGRHVWGGVHAIAVLLLASPRPRWWPLGAVLRLPGGRGLAVSLYQWLSRNRSRIPGGRRACRRPVPQWRGMTSAFPTFRP